MSSFDNMFKAVSKKTKKDPNTAVFKPGDINIKSHIPWGIRTGIPELDFNMGKLGWPAGRCVELYGFEHSGKMQSLDSLVSTPKGFKRMGDLSVGDEISDPHGGVSTVLGIYPQGKHLSYKITFKDGRTAASGIEHLWKTYSPSWDRRGADGWKVIPLKDIIEKQSKSKNYSFHVQLPEAIHKEKVQLPIDPYVLGLLLGDGGFTTNSLTFTNPESKIVEALREKLQQGYRLSPHKGNSIQYNIAGNGGRNYYKTILANLNLLNTYSYNKFIPQIYMDASATQRWSLLQGLMDTDGSGKHTSLQYHTSSKQLAYDFQTLVRSLGGTALLGVYNRKESRTEYRVNIRLEKPKAAFRHSIKGLKLTKRKRHSFTNKIISIEPTQIEEMQCIKVSDPEGLYITDDYTVTHNTTLGYHAIAEAQRMGGSAWFLDTEKSWDELRAMDCGVDPDYHLGIGDPDSVDATFRQIQYILQAREEDNDNKPLVIVVDSVTGAATESMKAKEIGEIEKIAQDAKTIRGAIRRIQPDIAGLNVNLFMINHATANITANKYAKQSDSSGGHAIKLAATVRCSMKHAGWIKSTDKTKRLGQKIGLQIEKLKGSQLDYPEVKETPLLNTVGFDTTESLLRAGIKSKWVEHKPSTKAYKLYDEEFDRVSWPSIVFSRGGIDKVYTEWLDWCLEDGCMTKWGRGLE